MKSKLLDVGLWLAVVLLLFVWFASEYQDDQLSKQDWYLGCVGEDGSEYLIKVNQRPVIKDGFIVIGEDMYVTPKPMTTCNAMLASEFDAKVAESKSQKIH